MFDEPTNGLDPDGIVWIRRLMRSLAAEGRVVLVSSHLMSELQDTADRLVVIGHGRLVAETAVADLLASVSKDQVEVVTGQRSEATTVLANAGATVTVPGPEGVVVEGLPDDAIATLLSAAGVSFVELRRHRASLEEAYMEITRGEVEFTAAEGHTDERRRAWRVDQAPLRAPLDRHPAGGCRAHHRPERAGCVRQQHRHQPTP